MIASTCSFCRASYGVDDFLALPWPAGAVAQGTDRTELPDGAVAIYRDCPCLGDGARNTLAILVEPEVMP